MQYGDDVCYDPLSTTYDNEISFCLTPQHCYDSIVYMENTTDTTDTLHSEAINGLLASIINEITRLDDATGAYEQGVLITRNERIYRIERYAAAYANLTQ